MGIELIWMKQKAIKNVITDCACCGRDDELVIYITDKNKLKKINKYIAEKTNINHRALVKYIPKIPKNWLVKQSILSWENNGI